MIQAFFDGCCEPTNPGGTAAYGVAIYKGTLVHENYLIYTKSQVVGEGEGMSNNVAEYCGLLDMLKWLLENGYANEQIIVRGDSKLVINQMFGDPKRGGYRWRIKDGMYVPYALEAFEVLFNFSDITGLWIPREYNNLADDLSKAHLRKAGVQFSIQPE